MRDVGLSRANGPERSFYRGRAKARLQLTRIFPSGFRVVCFGEKVAYGDIECVGDVDQTFVENAALAEFHINENVPSDSGSQGQRLLGHPFGGPDCADVAANRCSPPLPVGDALGIVLTGARRHASK